MKGKCDKMSIFCLIAVHVTTLYCKQELAKMLEQFDVNKRDYLKKINNNDAIQKFLSTEDLMLR